MNARFLLVVFDSTYLLALASVVGGILFYLFTLAPLIDATVTPDAARRLTRALLPRYFQWIAVSGAIALPSAVAVPLSFPELRGPWVGVQALTILAATLLMLYAGNVVTPALLAARDEDSGSSRTHQFQRRLVVLNGLVLVLGGALLVAHAARPRPSTEGIVELSPVERSRAEYEHLRKGPFRRDVSPTPSPR